jgi:hypothetical protein
VETTIASMIANGTIIKMVLKGNNARNEKKEQSAKGGQDRLPSRIVPEIDRTKMRSVTGFLGFWFF